MVGWYLFGVVWLAAIVASIPVAFVAAYFAVAKRFKSSWQRVILSALLGFFLAPVAFLAAYLLPLTILVIVPVVLLFSLVHAARHRNRLNPDADHTS